MKKLIGLILLFICITSVGQSVKRGYKSLGKLEYDKAYNAFREALSDSKDNIAANLGMALVLADDSSEYFDIIDAWEYIERIQGKTTGLSQEDIEIISAYFMDSEVDKSSRPVKKKIENALEAIEARLIKYIREENNLEAVYETLSRYPNFRHHDNIIHIRNQFEFRKYEKINTIEAYEEFIIKFPDAAQVEEANRYRNQLAFENARKANTVQAFNNYITQFPESEHIQTALKLRNAAAFADAGKLNTLEAYELFVTSYPDALEVLEAKNRQQNILYEKAKRVKSLQAYNDFIKKYPEGQYFIDIFNLKSVELGTQFVRDQNITNPAVLWVRGFDNNGRIESGGTLAISPANEYYIACDTRENDTSFADAWIIKMDASGKMLWNKTIGQAFEDHVQKVLLDSKNNIIVVGYTWLTADSASRMGWMFKLANDGRKIWNKNLGKIEINSCNIDNEDRIYIGGSIQKDSLGNNYLITIFNQDARKVGERAFTGRGSVNDILFTPSGELLLCGSNWLALLDERRYLKWDAALETNYSALRCSINASGDYFVAGSNNESIFYSKYSSSGKKLWYQPYEKSDTSLYINAVSSVNQNMIVLENKSSGSKIKIFSIDGQILSTREFPSGISVSDTKSDSNATILLFNNNDLLLIRFSQLNSL